MRHRQEVKGSVDFFSLCSSIFLLCGHTLLSLQLIYLQTTVHFRNTACKTLSHVRILTTI